MGANILLKCSQMRTNLKHWIHLRIIYKNSGNQMLKDSRPLSHKRNRYRNVKYSRNKRLIDMIVSLSLSIWNTDLWERLLGFYKEQRSTESVSGSCRKKKEESDKEQCVLGSVPDQAVENSSIGWLVYYMILTVLSNPEISEIPADK